jgi:hypothetical protein
VRAELHVGAAGLEQAFHLHLDEVNRARQFRPVKFALAIPAIFDG